MLDDIKVNTSDGDRNHDSSHGRSWNRLNDFELHEYQRRIVSVVPAFAPVERVPVTTGRTDVKMAAVTSIAAPRPACSNAQVRYRPVATLARVRGARTK